MVKTFILEFSLKIDYLKLKNIKSVKKNLFYYETKKFVSKNQAFEDCLFYINSLAKEYVDSEQTLVELQNFYLELNSTLVKKQSDYISEYKKKSFSFLPRYVWGYYEGLKQCIKVLQKQFKRLVRSLE